MRRWEDLYELEAEYRDFEPRLPRIDLVLGVALSLAIGGAGLFGIGKMQSQPQEASAQAAPMVASEPVADEFEMDPLMEAISDRDVTGRVPLALCSLETPRRIEVRVLESDDLEEVLEFTFHAADWDYERTIGVPTL
ncbi:MAG: hypothetical protein ACYTF7_06380 [Planctomycetota bacterium]|jgi:hypothetical protein